MERVSMGKGVAYLFRYQEVSRQAKSRYLEALAVVDDPTPAIQQLDDIKTRKKTALGRGVRAFNPLSRDDIQLFKAMMAGRHHIRGLSNSDIRTCLESSPHLRDLSDNPKKQSAKVSRILSRFHAHKLIAKIPRTRRWRVTNRGKQIMAAFLCLRDVGRFLQNIQGIHHIMITGNYTEAINDALYGLNVNMFGPSDFTSPDV
jgi:hypothetical protein